MISANLPSVIALAILLAGLFGVFFYVVVTYNRLVRHKKTMAAALSDIDVFLKKRFDLVPRLAEAVKGYAKHESETLSRVTELRSRGYYMDTVHDRADLHEKIKQTVGPIFALAEDYPDLKADNAFLQLQEQLVELEDDIEKARRYYNAVVRDNNILCESFPSNIVRAMFSFKEGEFFEPEPGERKLDGPVFGGTGDASAKR